MSNVTHTRTGEAAAGDSPTERMGSLPPPPPPVDPGARRERPPGRDPGTSRRKALIAALVVLVVLAVTAVFVVLAGDDQDGDEASPTTATTAVTSTTAAPNSTTTVTTAPATATSGPATTVTVPPVDTSTAVFPTAGVRYDDPVDAARAFAVDYVGFTDPLVGDFTQGDARSGEVQVRAKAQGPVTTVFVRQLGTDGSWWVLGSATDAITVDTPATGARITAPVTVTGSALAFEGTVEVEVRADGTSRPIGTGTVTGGGDQMRPFEGRVAFTSPGQGYGALMFLTHSAEDGRVWQAATLRVRF